LREHLCDSCSNAPHAFYVGVGYRSFSIAPVRLRGALKVLSHDTVDECRRIAARILEAPRTLDVQKVLVNLEVD
jgi:phosphoenolpyruvate-protein kinase (PTS system EI component)